MENCDNRFLKIMTGHIRYADHDLDEPDGQINDEMPSDVAHLNGFFYPQD
ncbi:MAG TPA: hypothetical protein VGK23_05015 [Methanomassiliicoccales archaeon]|jgi:hypothetical protein